MTYVGHSFFSQASFNGERMQNIAPFMPVESVWVCHTVLDQSQQQTSTKTSFPLRFLCPCPPSLKDKVHDLNAISTVCTKDFNPNPLACKLWSAASAVVFSPKRSSERVRGKSRAQLRPKLIRELRRRGFRECVSDSPCRDV